MGVGAVIRSYREQRGMTQADLAEKAHVDQSYLSRLETGSRDSRPNAEALAKIACVLDVTVDQLLLQGGLRPSQDREGELRWMRLERTFRALSPDRQAELLAIAEALRNLPVP